MSRKKITTGLYSSFVIPRMLAVSGLKKKKDLAKLIDIPAQSITRYSARPRDKWDPEIPPEWVIRFMQMTDSTLEDLMHDGEGKEIKRMDDGLDFGLQRIKPDMIIRYFREGSAEVEIEKILMECAQKWADEVFKGGRENLLGWTMNSDNMAPTIKEGAFIVIDTTKKEIDGGGIYAFEVHGRIMIRRVMERFDGGAEIINDNSSYPAMRLPTHPNHGGISVVGPTKLLGRVRMVANPV